MRSELHYRDAVPGDLPAIVDIYNSTIASRMVTADTEPVTVESRRAWMEGHRPRKRPLWIVEDGEQLVGWVSFKDFYGRPAYNGTAELAIYLHPDQRGRGVGAQILDHCIASAPGLGIETLLGFIFAHNEPSLKLFKKKGFTQWGYFPRIAKMDLRDYDLVILGCSLRSK